MKKLTIILQIVIGFTILIYGIKMIINMPINEIRNDIIQMPIYYIIIPILSYLIAHTLRIFRIKLLSQKKNLNIKKLLITEFLTAGANLLIPFRLGEAFRIYEYNKHIKKLGRTISIISTERLCDIFTIITFVSFSFKTLPLNQQIEQKIMVLLIISISLIIFTIFTIDKINILFESWQKKHPSVKWLQFLADIIKQFQELRHLSIKSVFIIFILSVLIWIGDIFAFFYIQHFVIEKTIFIQCALTTFLFSIIPAGPVGTGNIQLAFSLIAKIYQNKNILNLSIIYQAIILCPVAMISIILFAIQKCHPSEKKY